MFLFLILVKFLIVVLKVREWFLHVSLLWGPFIIIIYLFRENGIHPWQCLQLTTYIYIYKSNKIVGGFHLGKAYSLEDSKVESSLFHQEMNGLNQPPGAIKPPLPWCLMRFSCLKLLVHFVEKQLQPSVLRWPEWRGQKTSTDVGQKHSRPVKPTTKKGTSLFESSNCLLKKDIWGQ